MYKFIINKDTPPYRLDRMEKHNVRADKITTLIDDMVLDNVRSSSQGSNYKEIRDRIWSDRYDGLGKGQIMASLKRLLDSGKLKTYNNIGIKHESSATIYLKQ